MQKGQKWKRAYSLYYVHIFTNFQNYYYKCWHKRHFDEHFIAC